MSAKTCAKIQKIVQNDVKNEYICKNILYHCKNNSIMPEKIMYRAMMCAIFIGLCVSVMAQKDISRITKPIVNEYARVTAISGSTVTLDAEVASMFVPANLPDTVLLIQMTGISQNGNNANNAGRYEIHIVTAVSGQNVTLKTEAGAFDDPLTEIVQMVRVPSYKNAVIETTLTCEPWDRAAGTGGVLALMVDETLTFNADIDVSGRGFKGGSAYNAPYPDGGPCEFDENGLTGSRDFPESYIFAGYKGEGAVTKDYFDNNPKGFGRTWNGGGGGNGKWAGGGGGANGNNGGIGENQACGAPGSELIPDDGYVTHGNNGFAFKYKDVIPSEDAMYQNRIFMGGGGGGGTGIGTAGGNGGGIVIIVAEKLHFASNTAIKANGNSVAGTITDAGAGGGGGGGSILLSVKDYGNIKAEMTGGNGGSVYRGVADCNDVSGNYTRGAGGGGSGGFLLTTRDTVEHRSWYRDAERFKRSGGLEGDVRTTLVGGRSCDKISAPGEPGAYFGNYQVQLRGFLHNYFFTPDTSVCYGVPVTIKASEPKGGRDTYAFQWQSSSDRNSWTTIGNTSNLTHSFTEDVFYVRRMVTSGGVTDIGSEIHVNAYRSVINEIAPADTTICWKETFVIRENIPTTGGGEGAYIYHWQEFINDEWTTVSQNDVKNLTVSLQAGNTTRSFRRQVASDKGCVSGWMASVIHIQPQITGNTISPANQTVCEDTAEQFSGLIPTGGDGNTPNYHWQIKSETQAWTTISGEQNYRPELGAEDYGERFYRRRVTSGACESYSNEVMMRFDQQSSPSLITTTDKLGDDALKFQFSEKLYAHAPEIGKGLWTSDDAQLSFDVPNEPVATVSNLKFGVNNIVWTVTNGVCVSASESVKIEVKDVVIPTGFSPNGDGINDCFRIVGGENAITSEFIVLDRYNNAVFESKSFKGNANLNDCSGWWDGRNKSGNELPSGVYYYQLILNGENVYKGNVVLKRQ